MENNINKGVLDNGMTTNNYKKLLTFMLIVFSLLTISVFNVNSATENQILFYPFETGTGSLIIDQTPNSYNSVINNGLFKSTIFKWGTYSFFMDGAGDSFQTINPVTLNENLTFSFWFYKKSKAGERLMFQIYNNATSYLELTYNQDSGNTILYYLDNSTNLIKSLVISVNPILNNNWEFLSLEIDVNNKQIKYYRNSILETNTTIPETIDLGNLNDNIKWGEDILGNRDINAYFDSFRIFDFLIDNNQRNSLFATDSIIFNTNTNGTGNNTQNNVNNITKISLISSYSPLNNQAVNNPINFQLNTNQQVDKCDLYIDNIFEKSFNNMLSFNYNKKLNNGNHNYFVYCELISNSVKYYDITPIIPFISTTGSSQINFVFTGTDFNVNSFSLELVSPCLNKGYTFLGALDGYRPIANVGGAQFKDVVNGVASMTLPQGEHEFCLINGIVSYDTYNHTNSWVASKVIKQIDIGKFNLPNNLTTTYNINLDNFDMYDKDNPKAWGQSWMTLISSIIAFILGITILFAGVVTESKGAVMIGGLLLLFSLGYQLTNIVLGVLV